MASADAFFVVSFLFLSTFLSGVEGLGFVEDIFLLERVGPGLSSLCPNEDLMTEGGVCLCSKKVQRPPL